MTFRRSPSRAHVRVGAVLAAALLAVTAAPAIAGKGDRGERADRKAERQQQRQVAGQQRQATRGGQGKRAAGEAKPVTGGRGKGKAAPAKAKAKTGAGSGESKQATEAQPVAVAIPAATPAATPVVTPVAVAPVAPSPAKSPPAAGSKPRRRKPGAKQRSATGVRSRVAASAAPSALAPEPTRVAPTRGGTPPAAKADRETKESESPAAPVTRTVRDLVEVVPEPVKLLLAALGVLSLVLGGGYALTSVRASRLSRQRSDLLQQVGLLQTALLPPVPSTVGAVRTSVAYRPSDGPGAGGDFYDAMTLPGGRAAFILGDVSGHGREALAQTAFMRYTLRAYLEAGLDPRTTLQVAGRAIDKQLGGDFATVVLAVHDPRSGSLTYACAGHPAPIVVGPGSHEPVLAASSPPIGMGLRTGLRQTTLPLPSGSVACLYTDGLAEARTEHGILGRPRLGDIVQDLGRNVTAQELLDAVAQEARLVTDDMATAVLTPTAGVTAGGFRSEQLEVDSAETAGDLPGRFLAACGVGDSEAAEAEAEVARLARSHGGAVLHVAYGIRGPRVDVLPRNVASLEAASRRAVAIA